ncbi:Epimerase family protein SA0724 [Actinobacillus pleuropneumoniae]|nr:Epimerase family protein SA0724 [Actinobacillus pleuropneumoniae]
MIPSHVYQVDDNLTRRFTHENSHLRGTGFIGQALCKRWLRDGHDIIIVTRSKPEFPAVQQNGSLSYLTWEEMKSHPERFERLDALVNLAGSSLSQRWTQAGKKRILQSRQRTVSAVSDLMQRLEHKPPVVLQASAMAIYGTSEFETFDEDSPATITDFPSEVVQQWEQAADSIPVDRLIKLRISVVLGNQGGALPKMLLPYKLGVGGNIGSGKQWLSWIHIDDIVELIDYCTRHEDISGAVNAASRMRSRTRNLAGASPRSITVRIGCPCLHSCSKPSWAKCRLFC